MNNKLLSIIIPVYNGDKYIQRCIKSLLNQYYKNIEILIIDDGSVDNTPTICVEMSGSDNRVKYYKKHNEGCYSARNFGLDKAEGRYITFVDSDDFVHPAIYTTLIERLEKNQCDISTCNRVRFYDDNFSFTSKIDTLDNQYLMSGEEAVSHLFAKTKLIKPAVWDKVYKAELFNSIRFPTTLFFEDAAVTYKLLHKSKKVVITDFPLYAYYVHSGSSITTPWRNAKLDSFYFTTKGIESFFVKRNNQKLILDSYVWRMNFGIEAWYRIKFSKEISSDQKKELLIYLRETVSLKNLQKMPISFKKKLMFYVFPMFPDFVIKVLGIKFDIA